MPLTDIAIRRAKAANKPVKLYDGAGLYLIVNPNGSRWWRFRYLIAGKEKLISLGVYPEVTLKEARAKRDAERKKVAAGLDPGAMRKAEALSKVLQSENTFEAVAREWFSKREPLWSESHSIRVLRRLEQMLFPWIGARPVAEVSAAELLAVLRRIEARGAVETAHRVRQYASEILRYGIATLRVERDVAADLRGALAPTRSTSFASVRDPKAVGELLRTIETYKGSFVTRCALKLAPLTFVRPGELRKAEWFEFDLDAAEWRIPAERMKMKGAHIVPLSTQAVAILRELRPLTGDGRYLFPGARTKARCMSENTVLAALRRLGYGKGEMTGHGFRSMASTLLNEQGWHPDAIERQLAHVERNSVRAAYNHAQHLPERRRMMQSWADYLDSLVKGAGVVNL